MKTKEELSAIKEEYEDMNKKLAQLSEDELRQVVGGLDNERPNFYDKIRENPDGRIVYVMTGTIQKMILSVVGLIWDTSP